MQMENFNKLTSTARQAYLARMKRLAECVPGREIRAGTRRIRTRQSGFTIKSSSSEQLSRFLQDPARTHLRLSVLRGADRSKIVHLVIMKKRLDIFHIYKGYFESHWLIKGLFELVEYCFHLLLWSFSWGLPHNNLTIVHNLHPKVINYPCLRWLRLYFRKFANSNRQPKPSPFIKRDIVPFCFVQICLTLSKKMSNLTFDDST